MPCEGNKVVSDETLNQATVRELAMLYLTLPYLALKFLKKSSERVKNPYERL